MFDVIKTFLLEHWESILSFICLLASFVLALIRKKPILNKFDSYINALYEKIPVFIDLVEKKGHGTEKKRVVLELCKEFLISEFGFYDFDMVEKIVSNHIEDVLNTPQKKQKLYNFDDLKEE